MIPENLCVACSLIILWLHHMLDNERHEFVVCLATCVCVIHVIFPSVSGSFTVRSGIRQVRHFLFNML